MNMIIHRQLPPNAQDAAVASAAAQVLSRYLSNEETIILQIINDKQIELVELPASVGTPLMNILESMAKGYGIRIVSEADEMSITEAAEVLDVSNRFMVDLLNKGEIPYSEVDMQYRIKMEDLMTYKTNDIAKRSAILDQISAESQEHDLHE